MIKNFETLEELIEIVLQEMPNDTLDQLKTMKWHKLDDTHFDLGLYLRNEYIHPSFGKLRLNSLTGLYKYPIPITNADDLSAYLVRVLWLRLNNRKKPPLANRVWEGFWNFLAYVIIIVYINPKTISE